MVAHKAESVHRGNYLLQSTRKRQGSTREVQQQNNLKTRYCDLTWSRKLRGIWGNVLKLHMEYTLRRKKKSA